ncbi:bifunctional P-450/NADPH-P450 reductase [Westerdykella ornata]|uniref:Bifunctional P-450/NADPH-P450 reductase n=1 Tax=Westerdykella ornata TaxID=318751 RepID=A0A6A6JBI3_WESOR|nr:bifunctional P-450/NADPH-P450 reductase [Westerdykella ornata]KAF2272549.1 bifunctional P-450/NADPH-P450 reductase [Westerdykella ornata]
MKWARHGPNAVIQVTDDFTRLTLDTIALCAMDYRFNSYYYESLHPFIAAMAEFLKTSGDRARRNALVQSLFYRQETQKYWEDIALLRKTSQEVIDTRKQNPTDKKDILNAMLHGVDPQTGEKMSEESIISNMITFLIAGHETTSGLLSFAFYYLLKNPDAYDKAQQEVDNVIGKDPINVDHLSKLPYLAAVLRETLRLTPTAPLIGLQAKEDTTLGGKYQVKKGVPIVALLHNIHRDPTVYGEDNEAFRPERMLDENFKRLNEQYPNCWKPFGNGMRACIGRPFAWQEALMVTALLLQNFNFSMEDPSYKLQIKQTLTIKPKGFRMRAHLRHHITPTSLEKVLATSSVGDRVATKTADSQSTPPMPSAKPRGKAMLILYGSNTGTCEALANRLGANASNHGFLAEGIDTLDSARDNLPIDKPVVIITASYEGQPADNAGHFVKWVDGLKESELSKVAYAVFGCGHRDWAKTFHRIPKHLNEVMEKRGGTRIAPIGTADAASGDIFTDFETWEDQVFWPAMKQQYGTTDAGDERQESGVKVEVSAPRPSMLRQDVREAEVEDVQILCKASAADRIGEKRHIEISLPSDMTYSAGDYLAILPLNPKENIGRAMRHYGLAWDSMLTITSARPTVLPVGTPVSATDVLGAYVELAQPASKRNVLALLETTPDSETREELERLSDVDFAAEITAKRVSVLDLLERFPSVQLPLGAFLEMLPPMRVRQYSISSSPLWNLNNVTLTYSVLDQPALSGHGQFVGVASNYLSSLDPGDKVHVAVRQSHQAFHLPKDGKNVPVIMIAAGTGIAPFRGFIQERAAQLAAGRKLAPAILFYGCHSPTSDALYADEMERWEDLGAVSVRYAYSRSPELANDCCYVQERVYHDRKEVVELFEAGAKVFVCGSREVGKGVQDCCLKIIKERSEEQGRHISDETAREWLEKQRNERFATDVFA